jgi:His-Xaa-Ser system protein HxsD
MPDEIVVEFDGVVHSLDALNAAAYRLIGAVNCQVEKAGEKFVCHLIPNASCAEDEASLRSRFIDLVTDEQLRERLASKTEASRNLILSLAFGALAQEQEQPDSP